jgi:hypothetical protein
MVSLSPSFRHLNERKPKPELSASQGARYKPETRLTADRRFLSTDHLLLIDFNPPHWIIGLNFTVHTANA